MSGCPVQLGASPWTFQCAKCAKQTSVTSGTIMHASKLALHVWLWAAYLMATHSNGISAFQLWRQLGLVHPGGIPDPIRRASELLGRRCAALVMD